MRTPTTTPVTGNNFSLMKGETTPYRTLSIRISTNGFCFCIYNAAEPDSVQYHFHRADGNSSLYANLCRAIEDCPLPMNDITDIKAIIATNDFTTLPAEYDEKQNHKIYYRCCFPKADTNVEIIANRLTAHNLTVLFPVEKNIYNRLAQMGNVSYYTPASILPGYIASKPLGGDRYMLAYYCEEGSLLLSINNGHVELINSFGTADNHNQLYYLLTIWKAQGLSQTDDPLYLCGNKRVEELSTALAQFIRHRERINPGALFPPNLLNRIGNIPFDLQALLLCE